MLNAVFAATGKWIRQRPLKDTGLPKALGCDPIGQVGAQAPLPFEVIEDPSVGIGRC